MRRIGTTSENERSWAIDLISDINSYINGEDEESIIKHAGGEMSLSTGNGSLFPDILLFGDKGKTSVLQGWELKYPDTNIDDKELINNAKIKTYKIDNTEPVMASAKSTAGFNFRTAESFLNNINKKATSQTVDFSAYQSGTRVYHKKFGEGTINYVEPEGTDLKIDINFDKVGHKRLMAKFANLEIL